MNCHPFSPLSQLRSQFAPSAVPLSVSADMHTPPLGMRSLSVPGGPRPTHTALRPFSPFFPVDGMKRKAAVAADSCAPAVKRFVQESAPLPPFMSRLDTFMAFKRPRSAVQDVFLSAPPAEDPLDGISLERCSSAAANCESAFTLVASPLIAPSTLTDGGDAESLFSVDIDSALNLPTLVESLPTAANRPASAPNPPERPTLKLFIPSTPDDHAETEFCFLMPFADSDSECDDSPIIPHQPVPIIRRPSLHQTILDDEISSDDDTDDPADPDYPGVSRPANNPVKVAAPVAPRSPVSVAGDQDADGVVGEPCEPRFTMRPTVYEKLTAENIDWCRYCGTTEGVNWRPGPWGKRTLCNKHGCDFKGYGFACKLPRLDLTSFTHESIHDRERPVLQLFCAVCHGTQSHVGNVLVRCEGCPKAYHQRCCPTGEISDATARAPGPWFCTSECRENVRRKRIVVELPRKRLPLMSTPKNGATESDVSRTQSPLSASADGRKSPTRKQLARASSRRSPSRAKVLVDRLHTLTPPIDAYDQPHERSDSAKSPRRRARAHPKRAAAAAAAVGDEEFPGFSTPMSALSSDGE
jgi:hypothetical protein